MKIYELKIDEGNHQVIEKAAALKGVSVEEFLNQAFSEKAKALLSENNVIHLRKTDDRP